MSSYKAPFPPDVPSMRSPAPARAASVSRAALLHNQAQLIEIGDNKYRLDRAPLIFPTAMGAPQFISSVAVARDGRVFLLRSGPSALQIFANDGRFIQEVPMRKVGRSHAMCLDSEDRVFVVDSDARYVHAITPDGNISRTLGKHEDTLFSDPFNHFKRPNDVAINRLGEIFVSDDGNSKVHRFTKYHSFVRSWDGSDGGEPLGAPHSICLSAQGTVWIADRTNNRVVHNSPEGRHLLTISGLNKPTALRLDAQGSIYVTDESPRLSVYDPAGTLTGSCSTFGTMVQSLCIGASGDIFLVDANPNTVVRLRRER